MNSNPIITPNVVLGSESAPRTVFNEVAPQLDLSEKGLDAPIYKYTKLTQVSGGTQQTIASTTLCQFNIPGSLLWNPARSFLIFDVTLAAAGGGNYNVLNADSIPIDYVQLMTQSGDIVAELRNAQAYTRNIRPAHTYIGDYNSRGPVPVSTTVANAGYATNWFSQPATWLTNDANDAAGVVTNNLVAGEINSKYMVDDDTGATVVSSSWTKTPYWLVAGVGANQLLQNGITYRAGGVDVPNAPQTMIVGQTANAVSIVHCKIPLNAFSSTLLAVDKNFYFGQNMQLRVNFHSPSQWGFYTSSLTATNATASPFANVVLNNMYLWVCKDANPKNVEHMTNLVQSTGYEMIVPWNNSSTRNSGAATGFTYSTLISPGAGLALKRIYTVAFNNGNTLTTTALANNVSGVKWKSIQTLMDARPIQDAPLTIGNGGNLDNDEPYNYMYPMIKNSVAGLSSRCWYIRNFWCDNFSDCSESHYFNENDTKYSGLSLGPVYRQYDVRYVFGSSQTLNFAQYEVYIRKLRISPIDVKFV